MAVSFSKIHLFNNKVKPGQDDQLFIDLNKNLPEELVINDIDHTLYEIGLIVRSRKEFVKKRSVVNHPTVIFTLIFIMLMSKIIPIIIGQSYSTAIVLGDIGFFIGLNNRFNIYQVILNWPLICSQLIYYYNFKRGIKPSFLRVFRMMAGRLEPASVGITDQEQLCKLLKVTRISMKLMKLNSNYLFPVLGFSFFTLLYLLKTDLLATLTFGLIQTILLTFVSHYIGNIYGYQFLFFYLLCRYLRLKLKNLNKIVLERKCGFRLISIENILQSFDQIYNETSEYNTTYWSKFLFNVLMSFSIAMVMLLWMVLYTNLPTYLFVLSVYLSVIFWSVFVFTIFTAASVNSVTDKSYRIMNSLAVSLRNKGFKVKGTRIKVFDIQNFLLTSLGHLYIRCNIIINYSLIRQKLYRQLCL